MWTGGAISLAASEGVPVVGSVERITVGTYDSAGSASTALRLGPFMPGHTTNGWLFPTQPTVLTPYSMLTLDAISKLKRVSLREVWPDLD
jgi:hypothetical protein